MWVVQDVIMSRSVVVICGSSSTPFEKFVSLKKYQLRSELRRDYQFLLRPIEKLPFGDILWLWDQLRAEIIDGTATLFSLIAMRKVQCADERDRVYAPLALCRGNSDSFTPDYWKSYREVYAAAMQLILAKEGILPLYLVEEYSLRESFGFPSWVIN
jgi:hypothetical protein